MTTKGSVREQIRDRGFVTAPATTCWKVLKPAFTGWHNVKIWDFFCWRGGGFTIPMPAQSSIGPTLKHTVYSILCSAHTKLFLLLINLLNVFSINTFIIQSKKYQTSGDIFKNACSVWIPVLNWENKSSQLSTYYLTLESGNIWHLKNNIID